MSSCCTLVTAKLTLDTIESQLAIACSDASSHASSQLVQRKLQMRLQPLNTYLYISPGIVLCRLPNWPQHGPHPVIKSFVV